MQKSHHVTPPRQAWILLAAVIVIGVSRHIPLSHPSLYNFSPVLAIFLVSGAFLKRKKLLARPHDRGSPLRHAD